MLERLSTLTDSIRDDAAMTLCLRALACKTIARGSLSTARDLYLERWPTPKDMDFGVYLKRVHKAFADLGEFDHFTTKAAVAAGTTIDPAWAGALITRETVKPL